MLKPGLMQGVMQSMLATAFIFAATIGYWTVGTYQSVSADATTTATTEPLSLPVVLVIALVLSALVSGGLLYRAVKRFDGDATI